MGKSEADTEKIEVPPEEVFSESDCPVCDRIPSPSEAILCPHCQRPHHFACWLQHKGCAEPGCGHQSCHFPASPQAPDAPLSLRRKSEPRMWFFVFFVAYVVAMYLTLFLLPEVVQDSMFFTLGVGFLFGCVILLLTQGLVSKAYTFDPSERYVFKETRVGPVLWGRRQRWRRFDALTGLDLQVVRRSIQTGSEPSYVVQAWLRDASGADLLLRQEELVPDSPEMARLGQAARLLGLDLDLVLMGESDEVPLHVSRITGMPSKVADL